MEDVRKRDISIDLLKFFAVFLIINSHMDLCYPKYSILATGGAIGDCLFLFASGYTLFWGRLSRFDDWYKRRVKRIFPSAIVCALVSCLLSWTNSLTVVNLLGGQFVIFIMIYYILLFYIRKFFGNRILQILILSFAISVLVYILWFPYKFETGSKGLYGISTLYRWVPYFSFMLMGSWIGSKRKDNCLRINNHTKLWCFLFIISLTVFYGIQFWSKIDPKIAPWQIITLLPLYLIIYSFFRMCNSDFLMVFIIRKLDMLLL